MQGWGLWGGAGPDVGAGPPTVTEARTPRLPGAPGDLQRTEDRSPQAEGAGTLPSAVSRCLEVSRGRGVGPDGAPALGLPCSQPRRASPAGGLWGPRGSRHTGHPPQAPCRRPQQGPAAGRGEAPQSASPGVRTAGEQAAWQVPRTACLPEAEHDGL